MESSPCEACASREKDNAAVKWCCECEEALCYDCSEVHKGLKITRNHHLVEFSKKPKNFVLPSTCTDHPSMSFDYFCVDHDALCCKDCLPKGHRTCAKVISVDSASKGAKESQMIEDSAKRISHIVDTVQLFNKSYNENLSLFNTEAEQIKKKVRTTKEKVIAKLNDIEDILLQQVDEVKEKGKAKVIRQRERLEEVLNEVTKHKEALKFVQEQGSEKQAFIEAHTSKGDIQKAEESLTMQNNNSKTFYMKLKERDILSLFESLGSIEIDERPLDVKFLPYQQRQSQIPVSMTTSPDNFTLTRNIDIQQRSLNTITGMSITQDGLLVFCDVDKSSLYFCDESDDCIASHTLPYKPWDIALIPDSTTLAISCRYVPHVMLVDSKRREKHDCLHLNVGGDKVTRDKSVAIAASKMNIYLGFRYEIIVVDLQGKVLKSLFVKADTNIFYMTLCPNNNLCYACNGSNVSCVTQDGTLVFTHKITNPRKVVVDRLGHIYVVDTLSNITKLSSNGTLMKIILTRKDNLKSPYALCLSKDCMKLYVSNNYGTTVSVYDAV